MGKAAFLAEIRESLVKHTYVASPVKRGLIPKPDGSKRPLGIPVIRDRVVQMAAKLIIRFPPTALTPAVRLLSAIIVLLCFDHV